MTQQSGGSASGLPVAGVLGGSLPSPTYPAGGTAPPIPYFNDKLAAPVPVTPANTVLDILTRTLPAGTWEVTGKVQWTSSGAGELSVRLWNGATIYDASQASISAVNNVLPLSTVIVLASSTLVRLSAESNIALATILATAPSFALGTVATQLTCKQLL